MINLTHCAARVQRHTWFSSIQTGLVLPIFLVLTSFALALLPRVGIAATDPVPGTLATGVPSVELSETERTFIRDHPVIRVAIARTNFAPLEWIAAVAAGEVDAAIELKIFTNRLINTDYAAQVQVLDELQGLRGDFVFAVTQVSALLMPVINRALKGLQDEQRKRIASHWFAVDLEPVRRLRRYVMILVPLVIAFGLLAGLALVWNRHIARESSRRKRAEQRLLDMTERLKTGVFQFARYPDNTIVREFGNAVARDMVRYSKDTESSAPMSFLNYVDPNEVDRLRETLTKCLNSQTAFREAFRFQFPTGDWGWVVAEAVPARPNADGSVLWSGFVFDLTSERELNQRLNASILAKDEFIATAGHELRTPAHNIVLGIGALGEEDISVGQKSIVADVQRAADRLAELIDDLLDLSQMDAQQLRLVPQTVDISNLLAAIHDSCRAGAELKGVEFELDIDPVLPQYIRCDQLRVRQVATNLVTNAIKYTDTGHVKLSVRMDEDLDQIRIDVEDTGEGIAEENLAKIFEPFSMTGPDSRQSTGLGLAISQRLAAMMGGHIWAESEIGCGSTFRFVFPLEVVEVPPSDMRMGEQLSESVGAQDLRDRPILLVDDDDLSRTLLASLLTQEGFCVDEADNGREALNKIQDKRYSVIVTDFRMPGMNGLELSQHISDGIGGSEVAPELIVLTGGMSFSETTAVEEQFDLVLQKPISSVQLAKVLRRVMSAQVQD